MQTDGAQQQLAQITKSIKNANINFAEKTGKICERKFVHIF